MITTPTINQIFNNLKVGDKFKTYQQKGIFTISKIWSNNKGIQAYNNNDIYTYNLDTNDLIKLKIKKI